MLEGRCEVKSNRIIGERCNGASGIFHVNRARQGVEKVANCAFVIGHRYDHAIVQHIFAINVVARVLCPY